MKSKLYVFEDETLEILTKQDLTKDVALKFEGEILMSGKQACKILKYSNNRKAIADHVDTEEKILLKNSDVTNRYFRKLNNKGEIFLTEDGVFDLIYNSKLPQAKEFRKKVKNIVKTVYKTGYFFSDEGKIMNSPNETEKQLKITIESLENTINILNSRQANLELKTHLQEKEIKQLSQKIDTIVAISGNGYATSKIEANEKKNDDIKRDIIVDTKALWRKQTHLLVAKICMKYNSYDKTKMRIYKALEEKTGYDLTLGLKNLQNKALSSGMTLSKVKHLSYIDVISNDSNLKSNYIKIVTEASAKAGVCLHLGSLESICN